MINALEKPDIFEIRHYGILGMKWGVRKDESPRVKKARAKVLAKKQAAKLAAKEYSKKTAYGFVAPSKSLQEKLIKAAREEKYSEQDLKSAKILEKLSKSKKSDYQLKMEEKYKLKGMTDDEAAVAAYQNIKTKKILAVIGGAAITAAAGYAVYKYRDARVDKLLEAGTVLQNISSDSTEGIRDAFYSSEHKLDQAKYKGLYGMQIKNQAFIASQTPVNKQVKLLSDVKQASFKNAQDSLGELIKKDPDFAKEVTKYMKLENTPLDRRPAYTKLFAKAEQSFSKGIIDKNVYEAFNITLVDHSPERQALTDKFFDHLSQKGYNAIKDVNDSKYSGYAAINPIIAFSTKNKVEVISIKELTDKEVYKNAAVGYGSILGTSALKNGAVAATTIFGVNTIKSNSQQKKVAEYREDHPKTKLTNTEIIRMLEEEGG